jgi:hypothetical protein
MIRRIICLANSRKSGDRCIAGRELLEGGYTGPWVRPISARPDEAVSLDELRYEDGSYPRLLDIIDIPFLGPRGKPNQPENWLLDPSARWRKVGKGRYENVYLLADPTGPLWVNGRNTSYNINDHVLVEEANNSGCSLKLIAVNDLQLRVFSTTYDGVSKRRVQAVFSFDRVHYRLWATDSTIEDMYRPLADNIYNFGQCYLTISLAQFYDRCYKLVAGVIGATT